MDKLAFRYGHKGSELHRDIQILLEKVTATRTFDKDEIIYYQGDIAKNFCYLKRGKVKVFMTSSDGMEKTLNTATPGELLGEAAFFDKKPRVSSAKAITDAELVMIDDKLLFELISEYPQIAFELLEILANRIRLLSTQLDSMTFLQADARIAQLLLENEKNGRVRLTHEEIANSVGVSRVTVSKTLSSFAKKGIISTEYRQVFIKSKKELEKISNL